MPSYLEDLTIRLAAGVARLPDTQRRRHAEFFKAAQQADGGFTGRDGQSDLYYTGFALRGLAFSGELNGPPAERAAQFLRSRLTGQTAIVDFLSLVYGASLLEISAGLDVFAESNTNWRDAVADALERFRRADGGYAKGPDGAVSSTYHSFLVVLCRQWIGAPLVEPDRLAEFILTQRRPDGGFVEIGLMKRSGTNPTAAAIALLKILGRLEPDVSRGATDFLLDMQTDEGGLRANTRIPIADLLSTFTGLLTLGELEALDELDTAAVLDYVRSLEEPDGGFRAAAWDAACDVEYSFYGLAALALVQPN